MLLFSVDISCKRHVQEVHMLVLKTKRAYVQEHAHKLSWSRRCYMFAITWTCLLYKNCSSTPQMPWLLCFPYRFYSQRLPAYVLSMRTPTTKFPLVSEGIPCARKVNVQNVWLMLFRAINISTCSRICLISTLSKFAKLVWPMIQKLR